MRELLLAKRPQLATLARGWLAAGARSFSVWSEGAPLLQWPEGQAAEPASHVASIEIHGRPIGELRLAGLSPSAQSQLASQAELLAQLLATDAELEQMTAELVDTQDLLLAMYDLTQAMRSQSTMRDVLERLAAEVVRLVRVSGAVVYLPPALVCHPASAADDPELLAIIARHHAQSQEAVVNSAAEPSLAQVENLCIVPIRVRKTVSATLALINRGGGFSAPDLKLIRAIAEHAGAQIEHSLLYEETVAQVRMRTEMELAHRVQTQLLPQHPPQIAQLDISASSRAALHVGGDFYDFVCEPGRLPMFMLGDVSGKGVPAAIIMSMIRTTARNAARFMPLVTPASVLSRTNNDLYDDLTTLEAFVTTCVAQYDAATGVLRYASAGHSPIIYRTPGEPARLLVSDGVPVGVLPVDTCDNHALAFGPGSLFIVATDGLNEARSPDGELFGYERLLALVDACAELPAQGIAHALFDTVARFAAGLPQEDDQTLLVLKHAAA